MRFRKPVLVAVFAVALVAGAGGVAQAVDTSPTAPIPSQIPYVTTLTNQSGKNVHAGENVVIALDIQNVHARPGGLFFYKNAKTGEEMPGLGWSTNQNVAIPADWAPGSYKLERTSIGANNMAGISNQFRSHDFSAFALTGSFTTVDYAGKTALDLSKGDIKVLPKR